MTANGDQPDEAAVVAAVRTYLAARDALRDANAHYLEARAAVDALLGPVKPPRPVRPVGRPSRTDAFLADVVAWHAQGGYPRVMAETGAVDRTARRWMAQARAKGLA